MEWGKAQGEKDKFIETMKQQMSYLKIDKWIVVLSFLLTLLTILGIVLDAVADEITMTGYIKDHINSVVLLTLAFYMFYLVAVSGLYLLIDSKRETSVDEQTIEKLISTKSVLKYFCIVLVFWVPYLFICYPAVSQGYDYFWQLLQGIGAFPLSSHHPVLSSLIFGLLYKIGYAIGGATVGIFFTAVVQMLLMAFVMSLCLTVLEMIRVKKAILVTIVVILCVSPVFPTHCMWIIKDTLFSSIAVFLFLQVFVYIYADKNDIHIPVFAKLPAIIIVSVVFSLFRNGVTPIVICLFAVIAYSQLWKDRKKQKNRIKKAAQLLAGIVVFFIVVAGWNTMLTNMDVYPTNAREALCMPARQLVYSLSVHPDELNGDERKQLEKYYSFDIEEGYAIEDIVARYDKINGDLVKPAYLEGQDVRGFIQLWIKEGCRHPGAYVDAFLHGTNGYWWIGYEPDLVQHPAPTAMVEDDFAAEWEPNILLKDLFIPTVKSLESKSIDTNQTMGEYLSDKQKAEGLMNVKSSNVAARTILTNVIMKCERLPIVSLIFVPGLYVWLMLISLGYLFSRKMEGRLLWPIILILLLACLSPINGYMRYVLPVDLISLFLCGLCFLPQRNVIQNGRI